MKAYKLILGILIKNSFRSTGTGKSKTRQWLVAGLSMMPLLVILCIMLASLSLIAARQNILGELIVCVISSTQLFAFFFAIQGILSSLYLADDNTFLSYLPATPTAIYFAKITQLYISELMLSAYILIPVLLTMSIASSVMGYAVFPLFYPFILIIVALTPVLPLAIASVLSMPLMWMSKFFKKRSAMGTIVALLMFGLLFTAYYAVIPNISSLADVTSISDQAIAVLKTVSNVFYPNKVLVFTALGINGWVNFGISVAIFSFLIAFIVLLTKLLYSKAIAAQLELFGKRNEKKKVEYKKRGKVSALISRDFKTLVRYPGLAIGSFMNIILAPIMLAVMYLYAGDVYSDLIPTTEGVTVISDLVQVGIAFLYSVMLNSGINSVAGLAFTREGRAFGIMKHLPINPKDAIKSKVWFSNLVSAIGVLPLIFIAALIMKINWISAFLFGVSLLLISCGINALSILLDMRHPNLDWTDTSEIQRKNYYMLLPFGICLILGIVMLIIACVFSAMSAVLSVIGSYVVFWAIAFIVSGIVFVTFNLLLMRKGIELYSKMGENKFVAKKTAHHHIFGGKNSSGFLN